MSSRTLPVVALLIAVGMFFVYVSPNWTGTIAQTKAAIDTDTKTLEAAAAYKQQENALSAARDAIDPANLDRLNAFLPDSVDNVGLILDINALAARSGLALSGINISKGSTEGGATSAGLTDPNAGASVVHQDPVASADLVLSAAGTYAQLQTFLAGIEKSSRILDVQKIAVTTADTGVYSYQMTIRLYWLR